MRLARDASNGSCLDCSQAVLGRVQNELAAVPQVELLINAIDVVADRFRRDGVFPRDLLRTETGRDADQDLAFAWTQCTRARLSRSPDRREDAFDEQRIEIEAGLT